MTWSNREIERLCEYMANGYDLDEAAILLCRGFAEVHHVWLMIARCMEG